MGRVCTLSVDLSIGPGANNPSRNRVLPEEYRLLPSQAARTTPAFKAASARPASSIARKSLITTHAEPNPTTPHPPEPGTTKPLATGLRAWIKLLRPHQWSKGAFVFIGPVYGQALTSPSHIAPVVLAFIAFALASSGCYIVNDYKDREADRLHPRKSRRPLAAGTVPATPALMLAITLILLSLALPFASLLVGGQPMGTHHALLAPGLTAAAVALYTLNTMAYSLSLKHIVIADVISLSLGFVLRVVGGCAAVMVEPSTWLLNTTLFLAMFLAFGKRLGERRSLGQTAAAGARGVQAQYTDELLRMVVVVTAVACLITYAAYVTSAPMLAALMQAAGSTPTAAAMPRAFNPLWLTMLPATFGLLRAILLLEKGTYDDPTELALHDRPFQLAAALFALITLAVLAMAQFARGG